MFECDLKPYCNGDCNQCEYREEQLAKETIAGAVEELKKSLWELVEPVADLVIRFVNLLAEALKGYDNRRVAHLAAHSKKKRIRNKNKNRIMKWIGKGGRKNG